MAEASTGRDLLLPDALDGDASDDDPCGLDLGLQDQFFRLRTKAHERLGVNETAEWRMFSDVLAILCVWQFLGVLVFHRFGAHPHDDAWTFSYSF